VCEGRPSLDAHSGERLARAWASMPGVGLGAGREQRDECGGDIKRAWTSFRPGPLPVSFLLRCRLAFALPRSRRYLLNCYKLKFSVSPQFCSSGTVRQRGRLRSRVVASGPARARALSSALSHNHGIALDDTTQSWRVTCVRALARCFFFRTRSCAVFLRAIDRLCQSDLRIRCATCCPTHHV
jgi:hypothetical protein